MFKIFKNQKCICNDKSFTTKSNCLVCKNDFTFKPDDFWRQYYCKFCDKMAICGLACGNCCEKCEQKGWKVMSGYGGPPYAENNITNEKIELVN